MKVDRGVVCPLLPSYSACGSGPIFSRQVWVPFPGLLLSGLEHRTCEAFPTLTGALVLSGRRLGAPEPNPTLPAQAKGGPTRRPPTSDANLG